jgi:mannose-6-phosphate isomerase-like protein (cupin superfamily)
MDRSCEPVHLDEIHISIRQPLHLRPVITGQDGSSTLAWHAVVPPGGALPAYSLASCDEILVLVAGRGTAGQDGEHAVLRAGHCWLCPSGADRYFRNTSHSEPAVLVGFWPGAGDPEAAGYETADSLPEQSGAPVLQFARGILVHPADVAPEKMDAGAGWLISDFRLPFGRHNGCTTTLFRARFLPGAVHRKHRHDRCEEIYHVIRGHGIAGAGGSRNEVCGGHFHYVPAGIEHWLANTADREPIDVVGIYVGAGSVDETGYVYTGDVTAADLD